MGTYLFHMYIYIFFNLICLLIFAKPSPLTDHCHKVDWTMVNVKNKVLAVLLNLNVSCVENVIISICGNHFEVLNYGKFNFLQTKLLLCNILCLVNKLYIYVYQFVFRAAVYKYLTKTHIRFILCFVFEGIFPPN